MRLIDAEALLEEAWDVDCRCGYVQVVDVGSIENAPTIEAKPVVHAHWISKQEAENIDRYDLVYCCSACGRCDWDWTESNSFKFCPACGAQMDELVSKTDELNSSEKPNNSVKIPVISMEDVPKVMEEMEKSGKPGQNQQEGSFKAFEEGQT